MNRASERINVEKAAILAIIINGLQILLVATIALYLFFTPQAVQQMRLTRWALLFAAGLVCWGAVVDIREALFSRRTLHKVEDMEHTLTNMESLNNALRVQRHDFLNHLQVVFSLMEMQEYEEAQNYIEKVYGDIASLSRSMKTANPAVNALLQVKLAACEKRGIPLTLDITSRWQDLSIPGWEMCKVLSNLIDNAIEALEGVPQPQLKLSLSEDLKTFRFAITNNGPMIPEISWFKIFLPGITTKAESEGHGMGLFIVRQTLTARGGDITVESSPEATTFAGWVPKVPPVTAENFIQQKANPLQKSN